MSTLVVNRRHGEKFDVDISRRGPWGNPFVIPKDGTREEVIERFQEWLMGCEDSKARWIIDHVHTLRGKRLGCYCRPLACHGDILARLANGQEKP